MHSEYLKFGSLHYFPLILNKFGEERGNVLYSIISRYQEREDFMPVSKKHSSLQ